MKKLREDLYGHDMYIVAGTLSKAGLRNYAVWVNSEIKSLLKYKKAQYITSQTIYMACESEVLGTIGPISGNKSAAIKSGTILIISTKSTPFC
jgi:hypothetical protein